MALCTQQLRMPLSQPVKGARLAENLLVSSDFRIRRDARWCILLQSNSCDYLRFEVG